MSATELPEVKILRLLPGDILVAELPERTPSVAVKLIQERLNARFPDNEVVICGGFSLSVARPEDAG